MKTPKPDSTIPTLDQAIARAGQAPPVAFEAEDLPTVGDILNAKQDDMDAKRLQEALAYLTPYAEAAKPFLPLYKALWAEAQPALTAARKESESELGLAGCPQGLLQPFLNERTHCEGIGRTITQLERGLELLEKLDGKALRPAGGWEWCPTIQHPAVVSIRNRLLVGGLDGPTTHLRNLQDLHERIRGWAVMGRGVV